MADSSWDNSGLPSPKKKLGTGAKVAISCGAALLLAIGGCVAFLGVGATVLGKQMQAKEWPALRQCVEGLMSDEGARQVYRENPRLAGDYPTEESFLLAAAAWRPRLEPLPPEAPSVFTGRLSMNVQVSGGFRKTELGYTNGKGAKLASRWENGRLVTLQVD